MAVNYKVQHVTLAHNSISLFCCSVAGHGEAGVSDVVGTALWVLDYSLFASTQGIERIHFHQGVGYKYNFVSLFTKPQKYQDL
jgi:hypothetical protein